MYFTAFNFLMVLILGGFKTHHVLGLCEGWDLEVQMFIFSTMFIRIPNVQFSTEAQLLQNPC
jgi:hypothetical protein